MMSPPCRRSAKAVRGRSPAAKVFNGIFQYFFRHVQKHPVYLQRALNEIRPKLSAMDMDGVMEIVEKL